MDPHCNCEEQEYQDLFFIPKTVVICDTSTISANVRILLKETFFKLVLNILLTPHLAVNIHMEDTSIPNFKIHKKILFRA